ncbi:MAG TPA: TAT-variant-translocated molybdopterin oxidoreductase [Thermoanaerobaculia bacterium]|nr:TAT-variant-translocated molybdopterin oxidoreductase [Thermoanaerobaculia bacterium]
MGWNEQQESPREAGAPGLDLAQVREKLAAAEGPEYWRSIEELADTPEFRDMVHREFPRQASEWPEGVSRRGFLELSAASLALAGLTACTRQPEEKIVPYVRQPEELVPGRPLFYATSMELAGDSLGVLVESHMGRPTKVEGNPEHPASLGATDVFAQASILGLYDPDRSQSVTHLERIATWGDFSTALLGRIQALKALQGEGLRILTQTVLSPTLAAQIEDVLARLPKARWHQWEAAGAHSARAAARAAFGADAAIRYDFAKADVVVALDADFLTSGPGWVRHARAFAGRRKAAWKKGEAKMNRLYAVESSPTVTSTQADHRLALPPQGVAAFAASLAAAVGVPGAAAGDLGAFAQAASWVAAVAEDLKAHRGASIVIAGDCAPPELHVLAHALNEALGNAGATVLYTEPVEARAEDQIASIRGLTEDMRAGKVDTLLILGGNPVYDAPADLGFAEALLKVPFRAHLSMHRDETTAWCPWHLPASHFLEAWSDTRCFDGTAAVVQPLIEPLYPSAKSAHEVMALLGATTDATGYELVRGHWQRTVLAGAGAGFEAAWRKAVHDGVAGVGAAASKAVPVAADAVARACAAARESGGGMALLFRPDPGLYDGRFANNGWLQEVPRPLTKLTWDNALLLSPREAEKLGLATESIAEVAAGGKKLALPVWVLPGHAEGCATVHLGWGRSRAGKVGSGVGVDVYPLRTSAALWQAGGVTITKGSGEHTLASAQTHQDIELQTREATKRHLVRHGTVEQFEKNPHFVGEMGHHTPAADETMYPPHAYNGYSWGLAIDLSSCVGCNACVVACQSENNIPVVGKEQVAGAREMHWIRIDRYFQGDLDDPAVHMQPVMCMHCELAPCEVVCPVAATVHGPEGLNEMVYNRCVGTRYCSNNCPYKVRRFNFLLYSDFETEVLRMAKNPDVTIRSRGVMEKCTYCVQRINLARIDAKREGRKIKDGEVVTACQQACPAEAIVFGDLNDAGSEVNSWKASELNYGLLDDLNTRPRTTYLAKLSNPNPALGGGAAHSSGHEGDH